MLDLNQIKEYFPSALANINPKGMLVEYLQYELLDSLFKQAGSEKLSFIGGTAIRIVHDSQRFSEDLDFDNFGLDYPGFKTLLGKASAEMEVKGLEFEMKELKKGDTFHCYFRFSDLLHRFGLSGHRGEKILVSVDTEKKALLFQPGFKPLNKFGIFRNVPVNPPPILLAQKLLAILQRKREKGRDFYDASFLAAKTKPDYNYIKNITGLEKDDFIHKLTRRCAKLDYKVLAKDVAPFLFDDSQLGRITNFPASLPDILSA